MKKSASVPKPKKLLHVTIGTPDPDDCPVCRAHGLAGIEQQKVGAPEQVLIQELTPRDILRCPCPLCTEARREEQED